ncbi:MAG: hypothetical protein AAFQ82_19875, partial [Myxococcota bacterium]
PLKGPFDQTLEELTMPHWLIKNAELEQDAAATRIESAKGVTTFHFGQKRFIYDRLGLREQQP